MLHKLIFSIIILGLIITTQTLAQDEDKQHDHHQKEMQQHPLVRTGEIDVDAIDKNKDGKVYQDPMDWNVISDKPGRCPLCEMKMKEVSLKEAKENLLKHGHKVKGHMHNRMDHDKMDHHEHMMNKENSKDHKNSMHEKKENSNKKKK
ncbi:MAG: hypothetical protein HND52_12170 [Ignavibacteriae bacterium]|nr:hypothetical protein [Ignavibacteriota bacterium]NOG98708.1 hypothetical protein [Ignavibacteriota bacterium]